jgi:hypothetical protein
MDQEMMQLKHELKEFIEHGQHILQKMEGSMGQRYYGMRGGQGGGYSGGNSGYSGGQGGYGNREPWMQGGYPQEQWPNVDPRWFM